MHTTVKNKIGNQEISITKFREEIVKGPLNRMNVEHISESRTLSLSSRKWEGPVKLEESIVKAVMKRRWKENWGKNKIPKLTSYCEDYGNCPRYCLDCCRTAYYK
jgi:hypothetical protein